MTFLSFIKRCWAFEHFELVILIPLYSTTYIMSTKLKNKFVIFIIFFIQFCFFCNLLKLVFIAVLLGKFRFKTLVID